MLAFLTAWISPETIWWIALFGLGFEILFALNILFVIYWAICRNKRFLLSLVFVILGTGKLLGIFQFNSSGQSEEKLKEQNYIKVMSFNVRLFDLYNWFHNSTTRHNIFEFLKKESPDII